MMNSEPFRRSLHERKLLRSDLVHILHPSSLMALISVTSVLSLEKYVAISAHRMTVEGTVFHAELDIVPIQIYSDNAQL